MHGARRCGAMRGRGWTSKGRARVEQGLLVEPSRHQPGRLVRGAPPWRGWTSKGGAGTHPPVVCSECYGCQCVTASAGTHPPVTRGAAKARRGGRRLPYPTTGPPLHGGAPAQRGDRRAAHPVPGPRPGRMRPSSSGVLEVSLRLWSRRLRAADKADAGGAESAGPRGRLGQARAWLTAVRL